MNENPTGNHYIELQNPDIEPQNPVFLARALLDELESLEEQPFAENHRNRIITEVNDLLTQGGISAFNQRLIRARLYALLNKKVESSDVSRSRRPSDDDDDDQYDQDDPTNKSAIFSLVPISSSSSNGASSNSASSSFSPLVSKANDSLFFRKNNAFLADVSQGCW